MAATFENEIGSEEVSPKRVQRQYGFFDSRMSDYSMEKVNYPEKTVKKKKKRKRNYYCNFFYFGTDSRRCKPAGRHFDFFKKEVKMIRPKYNAETGEFFRL